MQFRLKINISFKLSSGSVYMAVIVLPGDKKTCPYMLCAHTVHFVKPT